MKSLTYRLQYALFLLFINLAPLISAFGQITPSQDSYTNTATDITNYGAAATLGVASSSTSIQNTYIQFNLSSIPAGYTSANVVKATLKLYVSQASTGSSAGVAGLIGHPGPVPYLSRARSRHAGAPQTSWAVSATRRSLAC